LAAVFESGATSLPSIGAHWWIFWFELQRINGREIFEALTSYPLFVKAVFNTLCQTMISRIRTRFEYQGIVFPKDIPLIVTKEALKFAKTRNTLSLDLTETQLNQLAATLSEPLGVFRNEFKHLFEILQLLCKLSSSNQLALSSNVTFAKSITMRIPEIVSTEEEVVAQLVYAMQILKLTWLEDRKVGKSEFYDVYIEGCKRLLRTLQCLEFTEVPLLLESVLEGFQELAIRLLSIHRPFSILFDTANAPYWSIFVRLLIHYKESNNIVSSVVEILMALLLDMPSSIRELLLKPCLEDLKQCLDEQGHEPPMQEYTNQLLTLIIALSGDIISLNRLLFELISDRLVLYNAKQDLVSHYEIGCLEDVVFTQVWCHLLPRQQQLTTHEKNHAMALFQGLQYLHQWQHFAIVLQTLDTLIEFVNTHQSLSSVVNDTTFPAVLGLLLQVFYNGMMSFDRPQEAIDVFKGLLRLIHALSDEITESWVQGVTVVCFLFTCLHEHPQDRELVLLISQALVGWDLQYLTQSEVGIELGSSMVNSEMLYLIELFRLYQQDLEILDILCKVILMLHSSPVVSEFADVGVFITVFEQYQTITIPRSIFKALSCFKLNKDHIERVLHIAMHAIRTSTEPTTTNLMGLFECLTQSDPVIERVCALMMDNVTYRQAVVDMMRFKAREDSSSDASMFVYIDKWLSYGTHGDDENPLLSILGNTDGFCEALVACIERHNVPSHARILMGKILLNLLKFHVTARTIFLSTKQLPALLMQVFSAASALPDAVSCLGSMTGRSIALLLQYDSDGSAHKALCEIPNHCEIIICILRASIEKVNLIDWLSIMHALLSFQREDCRYLQFESEATLLAVFHDSLTLWLSLLEQYSHDERICDSLCGILQVFSEPSYLSYSSNIQSLETLQKLIQQLVLIITSTDCDQTCTQRVCRAICSFMQNHCYLTLSEEGSQFCLNHLLQSLFAKVDITTDIVVIPSWFEHNEQHVLDVLHILLQHHMENNISCSIDVMQQMYALLKQYRKDGHVIVNICQVLSVYSQCVISDNKTFTEIHNVSLLVQLIRMHKSQSSVVCAIAGLLQILLEVHGREMSGYLVNESVWTSVWLDVLIGQQWNKAVVAVLCRFLQLIGESADLLECTHLWKPITERIVDFSSLVVSILQRQRHSKERDIVISLCKVVSWLLTTSEDGKISVAVEGVKQVLAVLLVDHHHDTQLSQLIQTLIDLLNQDKDQESQSTRACSASSNDVSIADLSNVSSAHTLISNQAILVMSRMDVDLYKGTWKQTPIVIKAKQLSGDSADSQNNRRSNIWLQELQTLSSLRHPRIVTLLGCCLDFNPSKSLHIPPSPTTAVSGSVNALVLEYMEKGDLRSLLATDHAKMSLIEKLHIALDVSEGMRFLHESDVFHRDLKSVYVLIDRHGRAKLTGFGEADSEWTEAKSSNKTNRRNDVSTAAVALSTLSISDRKADSGQQELLKHADIYAFGVIIWELITGKVPWATQLSEKKAKKSRLTLTEEEERQCPKTLVALMNRCFQSASVESHQPSAAKDSKSGNKKGKDKESSDLHSFNEIWEALDLIVQDEQQRLRDREKIIPDGFICPITQDVMRDPVMLMDGHSYERKAIVDWLKRSNRSPLTNEELPRGGRHGEAPLMLDNYALKAVIEGFVLKS
jgi:serine/threonine protein kinase